MEILSPLKNWIYLEPKQKRIIFCSHTTDRDSFGPFHDVWAMHVFFLDMCSLQSRVCLQRILTDFTTAGSKATMSTLFHFCARAPRIYALTGTTAWASVGCCMPVTAPFFLVGLHAAKKKKKKLINSWVTVWLYFCKISKKFTLV